MQFTRAQPGDLDVRGHVVERDVGLRVPLAEGRDGLRRQFDTGQPEADVQMAGLSPGSLPGAPHERIGAPHDVRRVRQQHLAEIGEYGALPAAAEQRAGELTLGIQRWR